MDDYEIVASQTLFGHPLVRIAKDTVAHGDRSASYYCLESPVDAISCVAVTGNKQIVLTRQYRHAVREVILDLPGGRMNGGESPEQAVARELEEETGFRAGRLELLCRYSPFPGWVRATMNIYLATDLARTQQNLDDGEELEVVILPIAEVLQMILRGEAIDASLQLGLLTAIQKGKVQL